MANRKVAPIPVPPGATLLEQIEIWDMTQKELSLRLGMSTKHLNEIINGKSPITIETALKLECVLGLPASFWVGLEASYQEAVTRSNHLLIDEKEKEIANSINYAEIAKFGWVEKTRAIKKKIDNLRAFFGIANLNYTPLLIPIAFRKSEKYTSSEYALATWLRKGEIAAQEVQTDRYLKSKLKKAIPEIRKLTLKPLEETIDTLTHLLADCGIALAIVPHISQTHVNGAIKWISPDKIMLQLSLKGKYSDIFWFSLFHEIGHIYFGHYKKGTFIDIPDVNSEMEIEADNFAKSTLIPENEYSKFISPGVSRQSIEEFSNEIKIHKGIIVGRLMHDKIIDFNQFHDLRVKFRLG
ncbi:MAG: HigA family addiction module antitoxin [Candidatus Stygibacter australis]|nr:HigA family addiction module antitoxin [Candidatus Stygibacter australis]MDP8322758.1 HigA family addiction module antitoxin [Candidatus Stygibacter australis]